MVSFDQFWSPLKSEFSRAPSPEPGVHVLRVQKWSQRSGNMPGKFTVVYKGGNVIYCKTATTDSWRNVARAEFRKVYEIWPEYRASRKNRKYIVHNLGVENGTWIIPILYRYEHLMN